MASDRITSFTVMATVGVLLAVGGMCSQWGSFGFSSQVKLDLVGKANAAETDAPSVPNEAFIDPEAIRLLRQMGKYLGAAREFSFRADITYDEVLSNAQKIQYARVESVEVRRPNMLHVKNSGEERQNEVFYDGTHFTILDSARMVYTKTKVAPMIDAAVDEVFDKYGSSVPIADLGFGLANYQKSRMFLGESSSETATDADAAS